MKKLLPLLIIFVLSGCYDMTDIEDIKSISVICIDDEKTIYCGITTSSDEKSNSFNLYTVNSTDVSYGLNKISSMTGKKVSVSHLDAVIFCNDCSIKTVRSTINSLYDVSVNPKNNPNAMVAFFKGRGEDFFDKINIPSDTAIHKKMYDVFSDKYAMATECSVKKLKEGLDNNQGTNEKICPIISLDEGGNIVSDGAFFVDEQMIYLNNEAVNVYNLLRTKNMSIYVNINDKTYPVSSDKIKKEFSKENNTMYIEGVFYYDEEKQLFIKDYLQKNIFELASLLDRNADVLEITPYVKKEFITDRAYNAYVNSHGGNDNFLKNIKLSVSLSGK